MHVRFGLLAAVPALVAQSAFASPVSAAVITAATSTAIVYQDVTGSLRMDGSSTAPSAGVISAALVLDTPRSLRGHVDLLDCTAALAGCVLLGSKGFGTNPGHNLITWSQGTRAPAEYPIVRAIVYDDTASNGSPTSNSPMAHLDLAWPAGSAPAPSPVVAVPSITGTPSVGQTLTADPGTWSGAPLLGYQWRRCTPTSCADIPGATSPTHVVTLDELRSRLQVAVTDTSAGTGRTAVSAQTAEVYYSTTGSFGPGRTWTGGTYTLQCTHDGAHDYVRTTYALDVLAPTNIQTDVYSVALLLGRDTASFAAAGKQVYVSTYTTPTDVAASFTVEGGAYDPVLGPLFETYIVPAQVVYC